MTTVCCFDRVVSILIICTDRGSCLSRNVSLIIQIWRVKLCLKPLHLQFGTCGNYSTVGITAFVYCFTFSLKTEA